MNFFTIKLLRMGKYPRIHLPPTPHLTNTRREVTGGWVQARICNCVCRRVCLRPTLVSKTPGRGVFYETRHGSTTNTVLVPRLKLRS